MTTTEGTSREGQITWMNAIDKLTSFGYRITLDGGKVRYAYQRESNPSEDKITPLLEVLKVHREKVLDHLRLLQTPQAKLGKPILIESALLDDRLFLVANGEQAREIEQGGGVCYLPGETRTLLSNSTGMDEGASRDYLTKIHMTKKAFPGARIQ